MTSDELARAIGAAQSLMDDIRSCHVIQFWSQFRNSDDNYEVQLFIGERTRPHLNVAYLLFTHVWC